MEDDIKKSDPYFRRRATTISYNYEDSLSIPSPNLHRISERRVSSISQIANAKKRLTLLSAKKMLNLSAIEEIFNKNKVSLLATAAALLLHKENPVCKSR